jgi:hypothetical protein
MIFARARGKLVKPMLSARSVRLPIQKCNIADIDPFFVCQAAAIHFVTEKEPIGRFRTVDSVRCQCIRMMFLAFRFRVSGKYLSVQPFDK